MHRNVTKPRALNRDHPLWALLKKPIVTVEERMLIMAICELSVQQRYMDESLEGVYNNLKHDADSLFAFRRKKAELARGAHP